MNPLIKTLTEADEYVPDPKAAVNALPPAVREEFHDLYAIWVADDGGEPGEGSFIQTGDLRNAGGCDPVLSDTYHHLEHMVDGQEGWEVVKVKVTLTKMP